MCDRGSYSNSSSSNHGGNPWFEQEGNSNSMDRPENVTPRSGFASNPPTAAAAVHGYIDALESYNARLKDEISQLQSQLQSQTRLQNEQGSSSFSQPSRDSHNTTRSLPNSGSENAAPSHTYSFLQPQQQQRPQPQQQYPTTSPHSASRPSTFSQTTTSTIPLRPTPDLIQQPREAWCEWIFTNFNLWDPNASPSTPSTMAGAAVDSRTPAQRLAASQNALQAAVSRSSGASGLMSGPAAEQWRVVDELWPLIAFNIK